MKQSFDPRPHPLGFSEPPHIREDALVLARDKVASFPPSLKTFRELDAMAKEHPLLVAPLLEDRDGSLERRLSLIALGGAHSRSRRERRLGLNPWGGGPGNWTILISLGPAPKDLVEFKKSRQYPRRWFRRVIPGITYDEYPAFAAALARNREAVTEGRWDDVQAWPWWYFRLIRNAHYARTWTVSLERHGGRGRQHISIENEDVTSGVDLVVMNLPRVGQMILNQLRGRDLPSGIKVKIPGAEGLGDATELQMTGHDRGTGLPAAVVETIHVRGVHLSGRGPRGFLHTLRSWPSDARLNLYLGHVGLDGDLDLRSARRLTKLEIFNVEWEGRPRLLLPVPAPALKELALTNGPGRISHRKHSWLSRALVPWEDFMGPAKALAGLETLFLKGEFQMTNRDIAALSAMGSLRELDLSFYDEKWTQTIAIMEAVAKAWAASGRSDLISVPYSHMDTSSGMLRARPGIKPEESVAYWKKEGLELHVRDAHVLLEEGRVEKRRFVLARPRAVPRN